LQYRFFRESGAKTTQTEQFILVVIVEQKFEVFKHVEYSREP